MKKCVYCNTEIKDNRSMEVCDTCGVGVWGPKMFKAIFANMEDARKKGDIDN